MLMEVALVVLGPITIYRAVVVGVNCLLVTHISTPTIPLQALLKVIRVNPGVVSETIIPLLDGKVQGLLVEILLPV
jgi:hypothetical protein